jgi:hypothetical protein
VWVAACCWTNIYDALTDERLLEDLQRRSSTSLMGSSEELHWKATVWNMLYRERSKGLAYKVSTWCLVARHQPVSLYGRHLSWRLSQRKDQIKIKIKFEDLYCGDPALFPGGSRR